MGEGNGQQDNLSRLDRIERAMELFVADHEEFRDEHKKLLRSQVLLQDALQKQQEALQRQSDNLEHLSEKINFVVDGIDRDHREFHERLKRLEEKH
jgi:phosphopantothenate synthetase